MQNLNNQPSISTSSAQVNDLALPMPTERPRRRSLRMQTRFVRVVVFSGWLFARLIFWQVLAARYFRDGVEAGNIPRWQGYARSFRNFAIEMGGVMIKAGQFISTRADILPQEVIDEMKSLRDEVPGVPSEQIRAIIERELGPISARYKWFDDQPVAAASLGQVHRAALQNGDRVVVKVQRPGIDDICYTDLDALDLVAHIAMRFRFISRRADAVALIREFGRVLLEELSYEHEERNAARFAEMFKDDMGVYIPKVYAEHSSDKVLTIEDVTTIKIDDYPALEAAGISRKAVATRLMDTYLKQVFEERFFHADPHPGNLFVYPLPHENGNSSANGSRPFYLIFIDFGMTASLTPNIAAGLVNTLTAVITRDAHKLVQSYSELGFLLPSADSHRLEEATKAVFDQVWGMDMTQISNVGYSEMSEISGEFSDLLFSMPFQMPQDFIYLGRTFSILSGMCTSLDPTFNPWRELQPYTQKLVAQSVSSGGDLGSQMVGGVLGSPVLQTLMTSGGAQAIANIGQSLLGRGASANALDTLIARVERGDIRLTVEPSSKFSRQLSRIETQGRKTQRAIFAGSLLIASALLYTHGDLTPALIGGGVSMLLFLSSALAGESRN